MGRVQLCRRREEAHFCNRLIDIHGEKRNRLSDNLESRSSSLLPLYFAVVLSGTKMSAAEFMQ
jgi:hypothetical protein